MTRDDPPTLLVTGATGTVGSAVLDALADRGAAEAAVAAVRDPDAVALPEGASARAFDFARPETWGPALDGVDRLFLVRPPAVDADRVGEFAAAAGRVGVAHVVYLSVLGAERNPLVPHHRIERAVADCGADHTFLRASFFMQNLSGVHRADLVERDELFVPAGDGATSFVDARDVAAVGAAVLSDPAAHRNRAYDLTGPAPLTYAEAAAAFSDVLDREVRYADPSLPAFAWRMRRRGHPLAYVAVMCAIYTTARLGLAGRVTDDVERVLGRPPRDLRTFVADHRGTFAREGADG